MHPLAVNALASQCCDGIIALEEGWRTGTGYQCSHTCVYHWCNDYRLQSINRNYFGSMVPSEQRTNQTIFGTNMAQIVLSHSFQGPQQILTLTVVHSTDWEHMNMRWQVMLCHGVPMLGWIGWENSGYDHATLLWWQGQHVAVTCSDPKGTDSSMVICLDLPPNDPWMVTYPRNSLCFRNHPSMLLQYEASYFFALSWSPPLAIIRYHQIS